MLLDNHYNIFLIVIDALRPDHLGCYGYERETSPTIDKISEEGMMFERVISQSSWTKPSMASLLTSTYPEVHGVKKITDRLCYHDTFLPTILQKIGYITGCIQTNPFLSSPSGFDQGFDHYIELFDSAPGVYKPRIQETIDVVSDWLDHFDKGPFFLYLHLLDTHNPYSPPEAFGKFGAEEEDLYDGEIRCMDYHIGLIRDRLFQKGLGENTVLIITSDHGEEFEEHGCKYHAKHLYEEVLRIPLIISSPAIIPAGLSIPTQVRSIDIVPTILEMIGVPLMENLQGEPLLSLLDTTASLDRLAISQIGGDASKGKDGLVSINTGKHKLIWNRKDDSQELYHLSRDPQEMDNMIDQETATTLKLQSQLEDIIPSPKECSPRFKPKPKKVEFDEDMLLRLRGLGYID